MRPVVVPTANKQCDPLALFLSDPIAHKKEGIGEDKTSPKVCPCYACFQATEKLVPAPDSAEGWALTVPLRVTITISFVVEEGNDALIEPVVPPMVALAEVKETEPKFASGRIRPPTEGASAIHSAELLCAPDTVCECVSVTTVVLPDLTVMLVVKIPVLGENVTSAETDSPGARLALA